MNVRRLAAEVAALAALAVAVYAGTALGVAMFGDGARFPFWPALAAVVLPYGIVKVLRALDPSERTLHLAGAGSSLLLFYVVARAYMADDAGLWQLGWLVGLVSDPLGTLAGHAADVTALVVLGAAWLYGVVRASREPSFERLIAEASAGLAVVFAAGAIGPAADAPASLRWLPVLYMLFALLALAFERLPAIEAGRQRSFLGAWAIWIIGGLTAAVGLALVATFVEPPSLERVGVGLAFAARGLGLAIILLLSPLIIGLVWAAQLLASWLPEAEPFVPEITDTGDLGESDEGSEGTSWARVLSYITRSSIVVVLIVLALLVLWFVFRRMRRLHEDEPETREDVEPDIGMPLDGLRALLAAALQRLGGAGRGQRWSDAVGQLYFAVLRRAEDEGLSRPPASTPLEFSPELDLHFGSPLPGVISQAYSEARYGGRAPTSERIAELRAQWQKLGRASPGPSWSGT